MNNHPDGKNLSNGLNAFNFLYALAKKAGMEHDPRIVQSLKLISYKSKDSKAVREIVNRVVQLITRSPGYIVAMQSNNPFLPYPPPGIINGEIKIGYIYDEIRKIRYPFGISRNELNQHLLESGRSGAGKTTVLIIILTNLSRMGIPFCIFDFKRDYRSLLRFSDALHVFNWKNFRFNPLLPPRGTLPIQWASIFTDVFFGNFYSSTASSAKSLFLETLLELYNLPGTPSMTRFCEELNKKLSSNAVPASTKDSIRTIMLRLRPFIILLGDMVNGPGFDMTDLLEKQVVLELDGLTIEYQTFIATLIFHWIFTYRLTLVQRGTLKHILLFDEAKRLFSLGIPLVAQLVSLAREFGQGLILADQMPSELDYAVLANVYTTITLNLSSMRDINATASAMGLNDEQRNSLNCLPLKTAVVRLAGRYPKPFLIHIPDVRVDKNISDAEVADYMRDKLANLTPEASEQVNTATPDETENNVEAQPNEPDKLDDNEQMLLSDIKNRPFIPATERLNSLSFTTYLGQKLYNGLIDKGLVEELEIKTNYRGRPQKFYKLTNKGITIVGKQNLGSGKGGFEHRLHQRRLANVFEAQGYTTIAEEYRNGKNIDLGLSKDGQSIAVEIIISPQNAVENIEKDIAAGWKTIWLLCNTSTILDGVKREWNSISSKYPGIELEFCLLSEQRFFTA